MTLLAWILVGAVPVHAGQLLYVGNGEGTVSVFDTDTDELVKTIPLSLSTRFVDSIVMRRSTDGQRLFVETTETVDGDRPSARGRTTISLIDTATHRPADRKAVVEGPVSSDLSFTPGFDRLPNRMILDTTESVLYVSRPSIDDAGAVTLRVARFDARTLEELSTITLAVSSHTVLARNRGRIYSLDNDRIDVFDVVTGDKIGSITPEATDPLTPEALGSPLALSPGEQWLVAGRTVISLQSNRVVWTLPATIRSFEFVALDTLLVAIATQAACTSDSQGCAVSDATLDTFLMKTRLRLNSERIGRVSCASFSYVSLDGRFMRVFAEGCGRDDLVTISPSDGERQRLRVDLAFKFPSVRGQERSLLPIAQDPSGSRQLMLEAQPPQLLQRNGLVPDPEVQLLELTFEPTVPRRISIGDFLPIGLVQPQVRGATAAMTGDDEPRDGTPDAVYVIGIDRQGRSPELRVVRPSVPLALVTGTGLRPSDVVVGHACRTPDGCFCRHDHDCDDGDPCTDQTCHAAEGDAGRCEYRRFRCVQGVQCIYKDERGKGECTTEALRRAARSQAPVDRAFAALENGHRGAAQLWLQRARNRVSRHLARALKASSGLGDRDVKNLACNRYLFQQQLALLRSLNDATRGLGSCPDTP
jgi:hypothetical protein